jgi:glycine hydroxymethyltransferase
MLFFVSIYDVQCSSKVPSGSLKKGTAMTTIFDLIEKEKTRQEAVINLIASENYASKDVLEVTGSVLTNKYAEGYPGRRYYGGCEVVDEVEVLAIESCKKLFQAEHANVQPHSGSSANFAVYMAMLEPGDTVLGMSLSSGGHLTHGHAINFSGRLFNFISYDVDPVSESINYETIDSLAAEHKPKMIVAGASAYSQSIDFERLATIAKKHNAILFVDMAHIAGLVAAGLHSSPIPHADIVSSTTHKTLRGPRGGLICCKKEFAKKIDRAVMPGCQGGPLLHVIGAKAVAFEEAMRPEFTTYQKQVLANAKAMTERFTELGYRIVSGGTDNHLFLVDLTSVNDEITGKAVEEGLQKISIVVNRNTIPFDKKSPFVTSGLRIGTPAITTRGLKEADARVIVDMIHEVIKSSFDESVIEQQKKTIAQLCKKFPLY